MSKPDNLGGEHHGVQRDERLRDQLTDPPGLLDRVTARYPESLTIPPSA